MSYERSIQAQVLHAVETTAHITYASKDGEIVLHDTTPCIQLHLHPFEEDQRRDYVNKARVKESLSEIAHYASLRAPYYSPEYVVGLTHMKVGRIAAKLFGFELITDIPDIDYPREARLLRFAFNQPLCTAIMNIDTFIAKYDTGESSSAIQGVAHMSNQTDRIHKLAEEMVTMYDQLPLLHGSEIPIDNSPAAQ